MRHFQEVSDDLDLWLLKWKSAQRWLLPHGNLTFTPTSVFHTFSFST